MWQIKNIRNDQMIYKKNGMTMEDNNVFLILLDLTCYYFKKYVSYILLYSVTSICVQINLFLY